MAAEDTIHEEGQNGYLVPLMKQFLSSSFFKYKCRDVFALLIFCIHLYWMIMAVKLY